MLQNSSYAQTVRVGNIIVLSVETFRKKQRSANNSHVRIQGPGSMPGPENSVWYETSSVLALDFWHI